MWNTFSHQKHTIVLANHTLRIVKAMKSKKLNPGLSLYHQPQAERNSKRGVLAKKQVPITL